MDIETLIREYVQLIIESDDVTDSEIEEFSGAGAIVGAIAPTAYFTVPPKKKKKKQGKNENASRSKRTKEKTE